MLALVWLGDFAGIGRPETVRSGYVCGRHCSAWKRKKKKVKKIVWRAFAEKVRRPAHVSGRVRPARELDVTEIPSERGRVGDE